MSRGLPPLRCAVNCIEQPFGARRKTAATGARSKPFGGRVRRFRFVVPCASVESPSQQRQQAPGQCTGASSQFTLRNLRKTLGFSDVMLDATRIVGLRKIEEIIETSRVGKDAIELSLTLEVCKHLRHGNNSIRHFFLNAERRAHCLQLALDLAATDGWSANHIATFPRIAILYQLNTRDRDDRSYE